MRRDYLRYGVQCDFMTLCGEPLDLGVVRIFVVDEERAFDAALVRIQSVEFREGEKANLK